VVFNGTDIAWKGTATKYFLVTEAWSRMECDTSNCQGYASQPQSTSSFVRIVGIGFDFFSSYICRFSQTPAVYVNSAQALWVSTSLIICNVPEWPFQEGFVWVSVYKHSNHGTTGPNGTTTSTETLTAIPFGGVVLTESLPMSTRFEYIATWWFEAQAHGTVAGNMPEQSSEPFDPAIEPIRFSGRGFDLKSSFIYYCRFLVVNNNVITVIPNQETQQFALNQFKSGHFSQIVLNIPPFSGVETLADVELFKCKTLNSILCVKIPPDPIKTTPLLFSESSFSRTFLYTATWQNASAQVLNLNVSCAIDTMINFI
jgi:hypothetical protein